MRQELTIYINIFKNYRKLPRRERVLEASLLYLKVVSFMKIWLFTRAINTIERITI